ncbi:hypothetical protein RISK_003273 [Rhodopirellula islandica]|uniref:Uncharacterized protein n=1 Tax=Rhodopirellula islandica TaxID=595434 RepID=A0A0J1BDS0_RHOIS|nr:hypothetical protein [Rhodopirellula islandica]KLU04651.1 hypothetical protein RISK_003273 [Rhodopirellula islandica]
MRRTPFPSANADGYNLSPLRGYFYLMNPVVLGLTSDGDNMPPLRGYFYFVNPVVLGLTSDGDNRWLVP